MTLRLFDRNRLAPPRNLLITRLSAIGDCVLTIPLAVKAKQMWPDCRVTWIVDCAAAQLLEGHPAIDEVIKIEKRWLKSAEAWSRLRRELQARQFDTVLDPQGLSKSALLAYLSGAAQRISFDYSHSREIAPLVANVRIKRTARHMVDTYLQLLSPWINESTSPSRRAHIAAPNKSLFQMPCYSSAAERAAQIIADSFPPGPTFGVEKKWLAINAGAGWASKRWPPERFGRIAFEIYSRFGVPTLIFWAGEDELSLAHQIAEHSHGAACIAPSTNLRELLELIRRAALLITCDTAALQIASAVNTDCVALFGPTWADEVGPFGNRHTSIQSSVLPDPRRGMRRSSNASMNAIEISEVLRACETLLSTSSQCTSAAA